MAERTRYAEVHLTPWRGSRRAIAGGVAVCFVAALCLLPTPAEAGRKRTQTQDETGTSEPSSALEAARERLGDVIHVPELRAMAAEAVASEATDSSLILEEFAANAALRDGTFEILRAQVERGMIDFETWTKRGLDGNPPELHPYDPNDVPVFGEADDLGVTPLFDLEGIFHTHSLTGSILNSNCAPALPCELPAAYDIKPDRVYLVWRAASSAKTDLEEHAYMLDGKSIRMIVQNTLLPQGLGIATTEGFHAYVSASGCGPGQTAPCLVTVVERDDWFPHSGPWPNWNVRVELWETQQLNPPMFDFDQWGNPFPVYSTQVELMERQATVVPKPTLQSFWTNTLGFTILSARCTTCHEMDTQQKIQLRHAGIASQSSPIPSLLVAGESVLHCQNCHEQQLSYLGAGSSFPENIWATPTPGLDINWAQIANDHPNTWPAQICGRIKAHLPTHAAREQHFHEDARLFWAVEKGELPMGHPDLPTAPPNDYQKFIDRFDIWNDSGAPCP